MLTFCEYYFVKYANILSADLNELIEIVLIKAMRWAGGAKALGRSLHYQVEHHVC